MLFVLAQFFGLIATVFLIGSFQTEEKNKLLNCQIMAGLLYCLQYLCLGALSGSLMNMMTLIRNLVYRKFGDKVPFWCVGIIIFFTIFSYDGPISVLPTISIILFTIAISRDNLTIIRITDVISCILFLIYNVKVLAITGLIATVFELVFVMSAIFRYDIKKVRR